MADRGLLPEFKKPPVSEVALSVEFAPLENWHSPHAGLYWGSINKEYPRTEVQPPLPSQIERFGDEIWQQRPAVQFQFLNTDASRFWFLSEPPTRLIQVQRDRFIINWRKVSGDEVYPRYADTLRPRFEREWTQFKNFVRKESIGEFEIRQCEVTYVNDIPEGQGWEEFSDALSLFSVWKSGGSDGFLPKPESLTVGGFFPMEAARGRLHFLIQHLLRQPDQRKVVQLRLTARGNPGDSSDEALLAWMDLGREWVVRGFADLTSERAHELWERVR